MEFLMSEPVFLVLRKKAGRLDLEERLLKGRSVFLSLMLALLIG